MALRESEGCIEPLKLNNQWSGSKPGNAGAGKASEPTRVATWSLPGHSAGPEVVTGRPATCGVHASVGGEPDALTAHVRFWEGPEVN